MIKINYLFDQIFILLLLFNLEFYFYLIQYFFKLFSFQFNQFLRFEVWCKIIEKKHLQCENLICLIILVILFLLFTFMEPFLDHLFSLQLMVILLLLVFVFKIFPHFLFFQLILAILLWKWMMAFTRWALADLL